MVGICSLYLFNILGSTDLTDSSNILKKKSAPLSFILNLCLPLLGFNTSFYKLILRVVRKMADFQPFVIGLLPALIKGSLISLSVSLCHPTPLAPHGNMAGLASPKQIMEE